MTTRALTDAAFVIGQSHLDNGKPCQDYALSGGVVGPNSMLWSAVSDGCSSGGHTDVGARMWLHSVGPALAQVVEPSLEAVKQALLTAAHPLLASFCARDALATVGLVATDGRKAWLCLLGDGAALIRTADGGLQTCEVRYSTNAPRYPSYELSFRECVNGLERWLQEHGSAVVEVESHTYDAAGNLTARKLECVPAAEFEGLWLEWADVAELTAVVVTSDGISSYREQTLKRAADELLSVKTVNGQFLQRRMAAMARRWKSEPSAMPKDDLSAGALWFVDAKD